MSEPEGEQRRPFPAPIRIEGFFAWTWRLFSACFLRLISVFLGGVGLATLLHFGVLLVIVVVFDLEGTVEGYALSLASQILLWTVIGTLLTAIAAVVFAEHAGGRRAGADTGWRQLRPFLGHVVVSGLYVSMPLLVLVLFLGPIAQYLVVPAVLGPPVLVQAIVWERREFRDAATRAKNLLAGSWLRVVAALLVLALAPALLQGLLNGIAAAFLPEAEDLDLATSIWSVLILMVTMAPVWLFTAAAGTVAYLELRARSEQLDHAALAAEAETRLLPTREAPSPG
ncbi:MAG TPA: hypothetical protein VEU29_06550 [Actinomycetota bacterium]|nr:hypothetical protein [Actinomycetota bacterium]